MMIAACVIGLGLLTTFFAGVEERQHNPNQNPLSSNDSNSTSVELKRNRQGHYVVTGSINDHPVEFLLDTGATDVVIPQSIAEELGLRRGAAGRAITANGTVTIFETNVSRLNIGDIKLYNVRASINPAMQAPSILLGMSALKQIEFLQRGDSLTLRQTY